MGLFLFPDIKGMKFKAYGYEVELSSDSVILVPTNFASRKAIGGETVRVISFDNIVFLEFKKGNIFVNTLIIVGEPEGKTYIPVVPWKDNNMHAEQFYNALYDHVKPYNKLSSVAPKGLRNDRVEAYKAAHDGFKASDKPEVLYLEEKYDKLQNSELSESKHSNNFVKVSEYEETMPPIVAKEYAIIDLETTGLSPDKGDRIIEIGIMIVDAAYNVISVHETLINPQRPVSLTHVHGIDDRMVSSAPTMQDVNDDVLALLHNRIVVAHNAMFEQRFLNSELVGRDLTSNNFLDTLKYARLITPTENHKLGTIAEFYGVPYIDSHTAMGDVIITRQVLSRMLPAHPDSKHIASEDLTPYFHAPLGEDNVYVANNGWVSR